MMENDLKEYSVLVVRITNTPEMQSAEGARFTVWAGAMAIARVLRGY